MTAFSNNNSSTHRQRILVSTGILAVASLALLLGVARDNKDNGLVLVEQRRFLQSSHGVCHLPVPNDPCHTDTAYNQCMSLEKQGCNTIAATRSCPPRYVCMNQPKVMPIEPVSPPVIDTEAKCPLPDDECSSGESYQECLDLVEDGCNMILSTYSCPPQFSCGDQPSGATPTTLRQPDDQSISKDNMCVAPTGDNCATEKSYQECIALMDTGCDMVIASRSCPPEYQCRSSPISSATPTTNPEDACIEPSQAGNDCYTDASFTQCLALARNGCQKIVSHRSCPPVYLCFDSQA